jgi:polyisoprenoid-binding protein YceI
VVDQLPGEDTVRVTELDIPGYVAGTWSIDPVHSHVGFVIKHIMVSKVRGRFSTFGGRIVTATNPLESSVIVTIDVSSIDTSNITRDDHVRSADFFDAEHHPTMTYVSTGVRHEDGEFFVDGELTIRGVTRPVSLAVETPEFGQNARGVTKAGFSATAQINRMDFGVSYNGPVPGGGVTLAERVQIVLDVEADLIPEESAP